MASTLLTPSIIAKESLMQLDNNLVAAKTVYRAYESEFGESKIGDTLSIRKPVKYAVRSGSVAQMQDATEGKVQMKIDTQRGVDLRFPTKDLTLSIDRFSERYLKHPMIALANQVDLDILSLSKTVWNWVGTPGQTLSSYKSFIKGPQRLDEMAVPSAARGLFVARRFLRHGLKLHEPFRAGRGEDRARKIEAAAGREYRLLLVAECRELHGGQLCRLAGHFIGGECKRRHDLCGGERYEPEHNSR